MCNQCDSKDTYIPTRATRKPSVWEPTKKCTKCGEIKRTEIDFGLVSPRRNGKVYAKRRASQCRSCHSKASSAAHSNAYHTSTEARAKDLCRTTRARALKKGVPHDLTVEWLNAKLEKGLCEVTQLPFVMEGGKLNGGNRSFAPSLDRTDPTKGYTMDNVKVVCWIYNGAKGVGTHEDVIKLAEALINVK